jgi:hypothetical protein
MTSTTAIRAAVTVSITLAALLLTACTGAAPAQGGGPSGAPTDAAAPGSTEWCAPYLGVAEKVDDATLSAAVGFDVPAGADCIVQVPNGPADPEDLVQFAVWYSGDGIADAWEASGIAAGWSAAAGADGTIGLSRDSDSILVFTAPASSLGYDGAENLAGVTITVRS